MSTHTSPQPVHLPPPYTSQPHPMNSTPTHHLANSNSFADTSHSFSSSDILRSDLSDGSDMAKPSSKGKNGATGPAEGKSKPHICHICSRGFTTGGHLQRHQRIHTGVKAFKCPYPGCETRTSRQDNLQQHYRTHLSPTLRRGSGSAARAAVAQAMEAAGLKSTSTRQPRKSKGSNAGTPSSTTSAPAVHLPSPYATPTSQGPPPYPPYNMYDPQAYGYPPHPLPPPGVSLAQTHSATSSRVPSPVNGHSSSHSSVNSMPGHQPYYPPAFSPAYAYQSGVQPYRYPSGMPVPFGGPPHHAMYSPGMAPDHNGHMYSPMNAGFPTHSRESSYGVMTPGYPPTTMSNGYPPPRTQTSTPLSQSTGHDDRRYPSPPGRRRTPPSQGVVDPSNMNRPVPSGYAGYVHHNPYSYNGHNGHQGHGGHSGHGGPLGIAGRDVLHRASISSLSEGSGAGHSDGSGPKGGLNGSNISTIHLAPIHPV